VGLRIAVATLLVSAGLGLVKGDARAEGAESGTEALDADRTQVRDATQEPSASSGRRARQDSKNQKRREWWVHAREVLFADVELDAEQVRGVDAIVETQLRNRVRFQELDAQFVAAHRQADKERRAALDAELRAINPLLKEKHVLFDEMRALLTGEQRPIFDTNRARLVAEGQAARKTQRKGRSAERSEERMTVNAE